MTLYALVNYETLIERGNMYHEHSHIFLLFRGYIEAVQELEQQLQNSKSESGFDDIIVACGRFCFCFGLLTCMHHAHLSIQHFNS